MQPINLRPYQSSLKHDAYNSWKAGNRNVLVQLSTGGGKSKIMSEIVKDHHAIGQTAAVIAHRNELVTQMSLHVAEQGIHHKIIGAKTTVTQAMNLHKEKLGQSFVNPTAGTAVVGVDTLISRKEELSGWCKQTDVWLGDEWHHCIGNTETDRNGATLRDKNNEIIWRTEPNKWGKAVEMFTNARGLGFTATPLRADGQGLGRNYDGCMDDMVTGPSTRWLIDNNYLCDYEIVCPTSDISTDELNKSKDGDWSSQSLKKAAKKSRIVGDVVGNYCKYALGRKAIVFATDVETAQDIADQFNEWGIKAAAVSGKSHTSYRAQKLKDFAENRLSALINVDLFDEGFDLPSCEVVIMARPTASLGKYLQMIGRVLRYLPGKIALVIDHVSNVVRHGLPDRERAWSLARREKRAKQAKDPEEIELTTCKNKECVKPYEKFRQSCPYCGFEKPLPDPQGRSIEMVEGDLILLDKAALDRMRAATTLESPGNIADRIGKAHGPIVGKGVANKQQEKIEAHEELKTSIAQWAAIQRMKGFSDRDIQKKFYLTLGVDVLSALDASKSRKEFEQLSETIRGWYE